MIDQSKSIVWHCHLNFRKADCSRLSVLDNIEYIGPEHATPDFHWLIPINDPRTPHDVLYNQAVGRVWVHVEQFFGRIITSFGVFRNTYWWSHLHFDDDFAISCCRVNEHLKAAELNDDDYQAYQGLLLQRVQIASQRETKQKQFQDGYWEQKWKWLAGECWHYHMTSNLE